MSSICNSVQIALWICSIIFGWTLWITSIFLVYRFISGYIRETDKPPKMLSIPGVVFIILSFILLTSINIGSVFNCINAPSSNQLIPLQVVLYLLQKYLVLLILFIRLKFVFNTTPFQLSKCTASFYITLFILFPILFIFGVFLVRLKGVTPTVLAIFATVIVSVSIFSISLVILYVIKLIHVYKSSDIKSDRGLISTITKTTILANLAVSFSFVTPILRVIVEHTRTEHFIRPLFIQWDVYINLLCILFSYKYFKNHYKKLCFCMDKQCRKCWIKIIVPGDDVKLRNYVTNMNDLSGTTNAKTNVTSPEVASSTSCDDQSIHSL